MKTKGFTLVELLVVIAILAILATVSVVGYTAFIEDGKNSVALQELTQIKNAVVAEDITNTTITLDSNGLKKGDALISSADLKTLIDDTMKLGLTYTSIAIDTDGVVTYTSANGGVATWNTKTGALAAK